MVYFDENYKEMGTLRLRAFESFGAMLDAEAALMESLIAPDYQI